MFQQVFRQLDDLAAGRHHLNLRLAGLFHRIHFLERRGDGGCADQQPVIAQDQIILVAEILDQPFALIHVLRLALEIMIGEPLVIARRLLTPGLQPFLDGRNRHPGDGVGMEHAGGVRPVGVDRRMDDEPRRVDHMVGVRNDIAVEIDLHQARRGDFAEMDAIGVQQEMHVRPRHLHGDMGREQIVHPEMGDQPVTGGQIDPHIPFRVRHRHDQIVAPFNYRARTHGVSSL